VGRVALRHLDAYRRRGAARESGPSSRTPGPARTQRSNAFGPSRPGRLLRAGRVCPRDSERRVCLGWVAAISLPPSSVRRDISPGFRERFPRIRDGARSTPAAEFIGRGSSPQWWTRPSLRGRGAPPLPGPSGLRDRGKPRCRRAGRARDAELTRCESRQDRAPRRVGERSEGPVEGPRIVNHLVN